jgi:regulator of protease activity HflC (stomatin/prohibitin superfamily)
MVRGEVDGVMVCGSAPPERVKRRRGQKVTFDSPPRFADSVPSLAMSPPDARSAREGLSFPRTLITCIAPDPKQGGTIMIFKWVGITKRVVIGDSQRGLVFRDERFERLLSPGVHRIIDPFRRVNVDKVDVESALLNHWRLDAILRSGALDGLVRVIELAESERAFVWIDGLLKHVVGPGRHAVWTIHNGVEVEVFDITQPRFEHAKINLIWRHSGARALLTRYDVVEGEVGLLHRDGVLVDVLRPGAYWFWSDLPGVGLVKESLRERTTDIPVQDILTAERVSIRLNAMFTWRVVEPGVAYREVDKPEQVLYRAAQLALRGAVGTRDLDGLLANKDAVTQEMLDALRVRAAGIGIEIIEFGVRDIILPGEMRDLLNKVTEAQKAAEAALIRRREETAEMRHQANTAKLLESNPTLLRMRELEVFERIAAKTDLTVLLGEEGKLAERVMKLM